MPGSVPRRQGAATRSFEILRTMTFRWETKGVVNTLAAYFVRTMNPPGVDDRILRRPPVQVQRSS